MTICEGCGKDHEEVRSACRRSLFATARILCGFNDLSLNLHLKLCNIIEENVAKFILRILVLLPRGHLKSSLLTIAMTIWAIINNPDVRILLVQASGKKSTDNMNIISNILLGSRFTHFFPEIIPEKRDRWNRNEIEVSRKANFPEATVSARGVTSKIVGGHYDIMILDDVIDETIAESDTEMERVISWFQVCEPLFVIPSQGIQIILGTRWRADDLYQHILDTGEHFVIESGAHVDERSEKYGFNERGKPIWPERFPEEELTKIRRRTNNDWFYFCQYENNPINEEVRRFRQQDIQFFNWIDPGKIIAVGEEKINVEHDLDRTTTVDPSVGEGKSADEAAITDCGNDRRGRVFVLDAWSGRVNPIVLIDKIFEHWETWKPRVVGIESNSFQKALKYFVNQEQIKRGKFFPVDELQTGGKSKQVRIEGLSPYFQNKQVYLQRSHQKLIKQLLTFPDCLTTHDDLVDALAYQPKYWHLSVEEKVDPDEIKLEDEEIESRYYGLTMEM